MTRTFTRCFVLSSPHQEKSLKISLLMIFLFSFSSIQSVLVFHCRLISLHDTCIFTPYWASSVALRAMSYELNFNFLWLLQYHESYKFPFNCYLSLWSGKTWIFSSLLSPFHLTLIIKSYISSKLPIQGISVSKARYYEFLYTRSSIGFSVTICKQRHCNLIGVFWYYLLRNKIHFMFLLCQNVLRR